MIEEIEVWKGSRTAGTEEHEPFSNLYKRAHSLSVHGLGETPVTCIVWLNSSRPILQMYESQTRPA